MEPFNQRMSMRGTLAKIFSSDSNQLDVPVAGEVSTIRNMRSCAYAKELGELAPGPGLEPG